MLKRPWRALIAALIVLTLIASVSIADSTPEAQKTQRFSVTFQSRPDFAELYLDGKFVGSADVEIYLPAGTHVVEMRREGYQNWRRELTVLPHNRARVVALLKKGGE